jgi:hypothetical protein
MSDDFYCNFHVSFTIRCTYDLERLEVEMMAMKTAQQRSQADLYTIKRSSEVLVLTLILAAIKRGHTGRHQVHINFYIFPQRGGEGIDTYV